MEYQTIRSENAESTFKKLKVVLNAKDIVQVVQDRRNQNLVNGLFPFVMILIPVMVVVNINGLLNADRLKII
jgi:hypothetical protein